MGFIDFTNGEVLTADQMDLVMRQGIMRFADATARDTALSEVLAEGMMAYLDDTDEVLKYDGTDWIDISGDITGVTAGTALTGGGTSGNVTLDVDTAAVGSAIGIDDKQDDVITTQGDLVIGDASGDPVRLPVGSADQVLTSDGTTVSFQDAAGGGGKVSIASQSLTGATSITFSSIPQTYKDLFFIFRGSNTDEEPVTVKDNNSPGKYWWAGITNESQFSPDTSGFFFFRYNAGFAMTIYDYTSNNTHPVVGQMGQNGNAGNSDNRWGFSQSRGTGAITSVTFEVDGLGFSGTAELYGVS